MCVELGILLNILFEGLSLDVDKVSLCYKKYIFSIKALCIPWICERGKRNNLWRKNRFNTLDFLYIIMNFDAFFEILTFNF